ncbi:YaiO family outer membrane beta-barrel protein [Hydrogenobacter thermophilus]|uniref:YaiO family outer membrane beta-barrel protein n=1 Tax=Hydrogenobacter thermophilus TaxID=940 RepID=UPI0030F4EB4C
MSVLSVILTLLLLFETALAYNFRLEVGAGYEYLSPHKIYGDWKSGFLRFYHRPSNDLTYFLEADAFSRKNLGEAALGAFGLYKDWSPWLYTYSSLSAGSSSSYLPKFRLDHEFNLKLGPQKNIVPSVGFTYIKYHDVHKDYIMYPGITYYGEGFVITYKHFFNKSQPGSVSSSTDLISLGIGQEGKSWTYLDMYYGKQAYLATYLTSPEEVRQKSLYISLKHILWIRKDFALFGGVSYFKLKDGYEKYGFQAGFFKDF